MQAKTYLGNILISQTPF